MFHDWIKVSEDLPPRNKKVWVFDELLGVRHTMFGTNFTSEMKFREHLVLTKTTYWMPFEPKPPKI